MAEESRQEPGRAGTPAPAGSSHPMAELRRQMDRLFDDFTQGFRFPTFGGVGWPGHELDVFGPAQGIVDVKFDVSESGSDIEVTAEVPGMKEDDIDVQVSDSVLTIKGEKKGEEEKKEKTYYLSERSYGAFQRSFRLPDTVDQERIEATFDNGVLKVTLPKKKEAQGKAKKINVKAK